MGSIDRKKVSERLKELGLSNLYNSIHKRRHGNHDKIGYGITGNEYFNVVFFREHNKFCVTHGDGKFKGKRIDFKTAKELVDWIKVYEFDEI